MRPVGGFSFCYVHLEFFFPGLYREDGVHLSDIGLDIFNSGLQDMVEKAASLC